MRPMTSSSDPTSTRGSFCTGTEEGQGADAGVGSERLFGVERGMGQERLQLQPPWQRQCVAHDAHTAAGRRANLAAGRLRNPLLVLCEPLLRLVRLALRCLAVALAARRRHLQGRRSLTSRACQMGGSKAIPMKAKQTTGARTGVQQGSSNSGRPAHLRLSLPQLPPRALRLGPRVCLRRGLPGGGGRAQGGIQVLFAAGGRAWEEGGRRVLPTVGNRGSQSGDAPGWPHAGCLPWVAR